MPTLKKIKKHFRVIVIAVLVAATFFIYSSPVLAVIDPTTGTDTGGSSNSTNIKDEDKTATGTDTKKTDCDNTQTSAALQDCLQNNRIVRRVQQIVDFLSAAVGVVVVTMIIIGGIQYITAGDNPQKVTDAKTRISNALIALGIFLFMAAFLQWLIPGGVFG